jgi:phosphate transport system permease protein
MTSLTALCTVVAIGVLAIILFYIARSGVRSLNLHFLIETPKPVGEGGGIGNAIVGSALLLALSCVVGIPLELRLEFICLKSVVAGSPRWYGFSSTH